MQADDLSHVWIGTTAGELVRADAVLGLRCTDGSADAYCADGRTVRLAESGCAADFHLQLLGELGRARADARWLLLIAAQTTRDGARWSMRRADDLAEPGQDDPSRRANQPAPAWRDRNLAP